MNMTIAVLTSPCLATNWYACSSLIVSSCMITMCVLHTTYAHSSAASQILKASFVVAHVHQILQCGSLVTGMLTQCTVVHTISNAAYGTVTEHMNYSVGNTDTEFSWHVLDALTTDRPTGRLLTVICSSTPCGLIRNRPRSAMPGPCSSTL
jgi:hypothetical protein